MPSPARALAIVTAVGVVLMRVRMPFVTGCPGRRIAGRERAPAGLVDALVIREQRLAARRRRRPVTGRIHHPQMWAAKAGMARRKFRANRLQNPNVVVRG